jgi:hypothetical protein
VGPDGEAVREGFDIYGRPKDESPLFDDDLKDSPKEATKAFNENLKRSRV